MIKPDDKVIDEIFNNLGNVLPKPLKLGILWCNAKDLQFNFNGEFIALWELFVCDNGIEMHRITLNFELIDDIKDLQESILHELIHCMQYEQGLSVTHDNYFAEQVAYFKMFGFNASSCEVNQNMVKYYYIRNFLTDNKMFKLLKSINKATFRSFDMLMYIDVLKLEYFATGKFNPVKAYKTFTTINDLNKRQ